MILTEFILVKATSRTLPKIKTIKQCENIRCGDEVKIYKKDFIYFSGNNIVELKCDSCNITYKQSLYRLAKINERISLCGSCMHILGQNKMKLTVSSDEYKESCSSRMLEFNKTKRGKELSKERSAKYIMWLKTPDGINFLEKCGRHLPHLEGENHPRWNSNKTDYNLYKAKVYSITRCQDITILENYDKPRGLCGTIGAYQLDHIIPIKYGFENNIDPEIIGNINNLQIIPWEMNRNKGYKYNIEVDETFIKEI